MHQRYCRLHNHWRLATRLPLSQPEQVESCTFKASIPLPVNQNCAEPSGLETDSNSQSLPLQTSNSTKTYSTAQAQHSTALHRTAQHWTAQHSTACTAHLGTRATSTSEELFAWASTEIGPSTLEVEGHVAVKLVAVSRVVPFCISCCASNIPGTLPQIPGLPGNITLYIRNASQCHQFTECSSSHPASTRSDVCTACTSRRHIPRRHGVYGIVWYATCKSDEAETQAVSASVPFLPYFSMQLGRMSCRGSGRRGHRLPQDFLTNRSKLSAQLKTLSRQRKAVASRTQATQTTQHLCFGRPSASADLLAT